MEEVTAQLAQAVEKMKGDKRRGGGGQDPGNRLAVEEKGSKAKSWVWFPGWKRGDHVCPLEGVIQQRDETWPKETKGSQQHEECP